MYIHILEKDTIFSMVFSLLFALHFYMYTKFHHLKKKITIDISKFLAKLEPHGQMRSFKQMGGSEEQTNARQNTRTIYSLAREEK